MSSLQYHPRNSPSYWFCCYGFEAAPNRWHGVLGKSYCFYFRQGVSHPCSICAGNFRGKAEVSPASLPWWEWSLGISLGLCGIQEEKRWVTTQECSFSAQHIQKYHLDDVILRADILVYPAAWKQHCLSVEHGDSQLYVDSLFMIRVLLGLLLIAQALRKTKIAKQFGRKVLTILKTLIWIINSLNSFHGLWKLFAKQDTRLQDLAWISWTVFCLLMGYVFCLYSWHYPPLDFMYFSAQMAGLLCEEEVLEVDNVKYCGYCKYHFNKMVSFFIPSMDFILRHCLHSRLYLCSEQ